MRYDVFLTEEEMSALLETRGVSAFSPSSRRHTIWTGNWSSDVCSSDLLVAGVAYHVGDLVGEPVRRGGAAAERRSEERRVGKEGRPRHTQAIISISSCLDALRESFVAS